MNTPTIVYISIYILGMLPMAYICGQLAKDGWSTFVVMLLWPLLVVAWPFVYLHIMGECHRKRRSAAEEKD